jgi:hypothetical protein
VQARDTRVHGMYKSGAETSKKVLFYSLEFLLAFLQLFGEHFREELALCTRNDINILFI